MKRGSRKASKECRGIWIESLSLYGIILGQYNSLDNALSVRKITKHVDDQEQRTVDWTDPYVAYFDGLCEPVNPGGIATYGIVIKKDGKTVFEDSGLAFAKPWTTEASNNVAEYSAAIRALEWLKENGLQDSPAVLVGDSRLIINQLKGTFKVKAKRIIELHKQASQMLESFTKMRLLWVERARNSEADRLSRFAYHKYKRELVRTSLKSSTKTPFKMAEEIE
jgi:ribonuclease HI